MKDANIQRSRVKLREGREEKTIRLSIEAQLDYLAQIDMKTISEAIRRICRTKVKHEHVGRSENPSSVQRIIVLFTANAVGYGA